jgi:hypothetical protein
MSAHTLSVELRQMSDEGMRVCAVQLRCAVDPTHPQATPAAAQMMRVTFQRWWWDRYGDDPELWPTTNHWECTGQLDGNAPHTLTKMGTLGLLPACALIRQTIERVMPPTGDNDGDL